MNGRLERMALLAGLLVLVASLQFGFSLAGGASALFGALLLGCGATVVWLYFDLPHAPVWLPPLLLGGVVLGCTLLLELSYHRDFAEWFSSVFAAGASAATIAVMLRNRSQCNLCSRRLRSQSVTFCCPRCSLLVCDETCWNFEHRRCQMCLENRVPVLPIADSWWTRTTGPRCKQGRCQICLAAADQADLRACPHCRRLQCRDDWDFNNGECQRCSTPLPDLPVSLRQVIAQAEGQEQTFGH